MDNKTESTQPPHPVGGPTREAAYPSDVIRLSSPLTAIFGILAGLALGLVTTGVILNKYEAEKKEAERKLAGAEYEVKTQTERQEEMSKYAQFWKDAYDGDKRKMYEAMNKADKLKAELDTISQRNRSYIIRDGSVGIYTATNYITPSYTATNLTITNITGTLHWNR